MSMWMIESDCIYLTCNLTCFIYEKNITICVKRSMYTYISYFLTQVGPKVSKIRNFSTIKPTFYKFYSFNFSFKFILHELLRHNQFFKEDVFTNKKQQNDIMVRQWTKYDVLPL